MTISIIHPSRGRPKQAYETMQNWLSKADTNPEYILSLDKSDNSAYMGGVRHDNSSAIDAINNAAKSAREGLFVVISDDFDCHAHWDTLLLAELEGKSDFLVKTYDGIQPTLITLPIMDRVYYERFGYVYHPDYVHMFADQDMTAAGMMLGKVIKSDMIFMHNHYSTKRTRKDAINIKNDATWAQGEHVFNKRLQSNFGIDNPVMSYTDIKWR
jgi:hypothetical protein